MNIIIYKYLPDLKQEPIVQWDRLQKPISFSFENNILLEIVDKVLLKTYKNCKDDVKNNLECNNWEEETDFEKLNINPLLNRTSVFILRN